MTFLSTHRSNCWDSNREDEDETGGEKDKEIRKKMEKKS